MAKLKILSGNDAGKEFAVEYLIVNIGRDPFNDIVLDEITVSRRHAQILKQGSKYAITDQGSSNGTFVNDRQISHCELKNGDCIKLGEKELAFSAEDAVVAESVDESPKTTLAAEKSKEKSKVVFVKFSVASSGDMQKLQSFQGNFSSFLMGKTVVLNQALSFKNVSLEAAEIKPACGGIIDSATEVDIVLAKEKSAEGEVSKQVKPKFKPASQPEAAVGELERADLVKRLSAYLIDGAVVILLIVISRIITSILPILRILIFVPPAYFLLRDGIFKQFLGQSLGKKALGIMVVNIDTRQPATWLDSLKRQIFMLVPILNFIECIILLVNRDGRRLGDKISRTMVIKA